jgi:predicted lipase
MTLNIIELINCAKNAYYDKNIISKKRTKCIEKGDIFVRLEYYSATSVIVSFRGTDSLYDWMYNLSRWSSTFLQKDISVHTGFLNHMTDVYSEIQDGIRQLYGNDVHMIQNIYVTGHSLGGAVSVLFGAKTAQENPGLRIYVTTFGGPRVGNYAFKSWCINTHNLHIERYHNKWDMVTHLPYFGYYHFGKSIHVVTQTYRFRITKNHSITTYTKSIVQNYTD